MKTTKLNVLVSTLIVLLILIILLFLSISVAARENRGSKGSPSFFVISPDPAIDQLPLTSTRVNVSKG